MSTVAVYESLRDGTATRLLVNKADAQGVSRATLYDAVLAGDFFEWREADDCWVRYRVTEVHSDPPGAAPRKLFDASGRCGGRARQLAAYEQA